MLPMLVPSTVRFEMVMLSETGAVRVPVALKEKVEPRLVHWVAVPVAQESDW